MFSIQSLYVTALCHNDTVIHIGSSYINWSLVTYSVLISPVICNSLVLLFATIILISSFIIKVTMWYEIDCHMQLFFSNDLTTILLVKNDTSMLETMLEFSFKDLHSIYCKFVLLVPSATILQ